MSSHCRIVPAVVRAALAAAVCLLSTLPAAHAVDPPWMGTEVQIDHGFRYWTNLGMLDRCAVATADTMTLMAIRSIDSGEITGWRRHADGREIDTNGIRLSPAGVNTGPFDISGFDGVGWKVAYLMDEWQYSVTWHSLLVRDLDPQTLQPRGPDLLIVGSSQNDLSCPAIAWTGTRHVLVWDSGSGLEMIRIRPDMTLEDEAPIPLPGNGMTAPVAVAGEPLGGMIVARGAGSRLYTQPLDSNGLPIGHPQWWLMDLSSYSEPSVDVCRYADGPEWIFAGTSNGGIQFGVVDSTGSLNPPGLGTIDTGGAPVKAVSVAAGEMGAMIGWHAGGNYDAGTVGASIVFHEIDRWGSISQSLSFEPLSESWNPSDWRSIDCAWTGEAFAVVWDNRPPAITKQPGPDAASSWSSLQWLTSRGDRYFPAPVIFEQGSYPSSVGVFPSGDGYLAVIWDGVSDEYIHRQILDPSGVPTGAASRYATGAYDDCAFGWIYCAYGRVTGQRGYRVAGSRSLVLFGFKDHTDSDIGTWIDESYAIGDALMPDGTLADRHVVPVDSNYNYGIAATPDRIDAAGNGSNYLFAYDYGRQPSRVGAVLLNLSGDRICGWDVVPPVDSSSPSIATIGARFLMVWLEGTDSPVLRKAIIDPADGGGQVTGEPIADTLGTYGVPFLVPGPDQTVCVFPLKAPGGDYDIYRIRFAADGQPLDPGPVPICVQPGDQGYVGGVWDGNNYVLAWSNLTPGAESIAASRMSLSGYVFDSPPFVIADGVKGAVSLASATYGQVLAGYGGNRVRAIDDTEPLLDDGMPGILDPPPPVRIGAIAPNPGRGSIRVRMELPMDAEVTIRVYDLTGRQVRASRFTGSQYPDGWIWDGRREDGTPAPAGLYLLRIAVGGREEVRRGILLR